MNAAPTGGAALPAQDSRDAAAREVDAVVHLRIAGAPVAVGVAVDGPRLARLVYLPPETPERAPVGALAREACAQLRAYAIDARFAFDLPLAPAATAFQRALRTGLCAIPVGSTRTYGELAHVLGSAARAVGQACGDNPYPLVVPCHRVVGARGLGGFAHARGGYRLDIKRRLLAHEGALAG